MRAVSRGLNQHFASRSAKDVPEDQQGRPEICLQQNCEPFLWSIQSEYSFLPAKYAIPIHSSDQVLGAETDQ